MTSDERTSVVLVPEPGPEWDWARDVVKEASELTVLGEAHGPGEALEVACRRRPDVVLVAASILAAGDGDLLARLRTASPTSAVAVVGDTSWPPLPAGQPGELTAWLDIRALNAIALRRGLAAAAAGLVVAAPREPVGRGGEREWRVILTGHQAEVLAVLAQDVCEAEVPEVAHLSGATVERAVSGAKRKLGVRTLFMLGAWSAWLGLIERPERPPAVRSRMRGH